MKKENDLTEIQLKHRQQMKEKREAIRLRKERTHRLIVRGAIAEKVLKGAQKMTNEEFREALIRAVNHPQDAPRESPSEDPAEQPSAERTSSRET